MLPHIITSSIIGNLPIFSKYFIKDH